MQSEQNKKEIEELKNHNQKNQEQEIERLKNQLDNAIEGVKRHDNVHNISSLMLLLKFSKSFFIFSLLHFFDCDFLTLQSLFYFVLIAYLIYIQKTRQLL